MRHIFIINPTCGKQDPTAALLPMIQAAGEELGVEPEVFITCHQGHGEEMAREFSQWAAEHQEVVRLYACGGDGTLNEVIHGAMRNPYVQTGCVPCGSGNDFIRNYGTAEDFLDLTELMQGESTVIDMIKTNVGWSAAICAAGLDAQVAYSIPKFRRLPFCGGSMAYYLSILQQVCGKIGHSLAFEIDGKRMEQECLLIAICNGGYYGGGFWAAPESNLTDGLLDVVIVKKVSRFRIAKVLAVYKNGRHIKNGRVREDLRDIVQFFRCREIRITSLDHKPIVVTLDGECSPQKELFAQVVPQAATVVVPKGCMERIRAAVG